MDATDELVSALKAGERIRLVLTPQESVKNAHDLFTRLKSQYGLEVATQDCIVSGQRAFIVWSPAHVTAQVVGY